jgi:septal ring-binding cell division protein DamX
MLPVPKPVKKIISSKPGKPALQDNEKGLYVLQVYSSLSKEEADSKLDEYKNKGAEKVWVSTYTHSNVIWYRVRIGDFISKGAADAKAKELGVTNYWVDKIR